MVSLLSGCVVYVGTNQSYQQPDYSLLHTRNQLSSDEWKKLIRFDLIDQHALSVSRGSVQSIESLAKRLVAPAQNDFEKARVLFRWITANIEYDVGAFFSGRIPSSAAKNTLKEGKAVCAGYASLFEDLGKSVGLQVMSISGVSKGYGYSVNKKLGKTPNHAWNVVKLGDGWYFIDSTWGAGHVNGSDEYMQTLDNFYFLTPPEEFIYKHYPLDPRAQLLEVPVTFEEYTEMIPVWPKYFKLGVQTHSHKKNTIEMDGKGRITFQAPDSVVLMANLFQKNKKLSENFTFLQRNSDLSELIVHCPARGNYLLNLYGKSKNDSDNYSSILTYGIKSSRGNKTLGFPVTYGKFREYNVVLVEPLYGTLEANTSYYFKLKVPGATKVAVVQNGIYHQLNQENGNFSGGVQLEHGIAEVYANFTSDHHYSGLLRYQVR